MDLLDFRSDTLTQPTDEMREVMAQAPVGDDVYGEDPTVKALEALAAERLGMEAALFVPTGTMGNQIALWVHGNRQGQVLCHPQSHIALYEGGAAAMLSGTTLRTIEGADGILTPDALRPHLFPDDPHFARTQAVSIENTHNWAGGIPWTSQQLADLTGFAEAHDLPVHMDGARVWNAHVATGQSLHEITLGVSSIMTCLSKGLSAPVGSILAGSSSFIHESRRVRKALGGGMRQSGHLAAAGLLAMETMVDRLAEDHAVAARVATRLQGMEGVHVQDQKVRTNMVYVDVAGLGLDAPAFCDIAKDVGVLCLPRDTGSMVRFTAHRHVSVKDADEAVDRLMAVFQEST